MPANKPQKRGITDYVNLLSGKFEIENIEITKYEIKNLKDFENLEKIAFGKYFSLQFTICFLRKRNFRKGNKAIRKSTL